MVLAVLQELVSFYVCEMIIILHPVHWLILYLLSSVFCFSILIIAAGTFVAVFTRNDLSL